MQEDLRGWEIAIPVLGSIAIVAGGAAQYSIRPLAEMDAIGVVGEGATALALLVVIGAIHQFRTSLDTDVYRSFVVGFTFLYLSATLDFVDEFVAVGELLTYTIENAGGVLGAVGLAVAFGHWVKRYEDRGRTLTEQEKRLRRRNDQLEVLNRIVSHDIKNDLNVIDGRIQLARNQVDGEVREHLERAHRSTVDAIDLTDTVHDFIEALNRDDPELEPIPLQRELETQIQRTRQSHPDAELRFERTAESEVHVLADEMVAALLRNLLVNGVKHNDEAVPRITVSVDREPESVVVRVADNGPGIPDESKERVFGCHEQGADSTGTGVGLYLVDRLVDQYGGEVWVSDNEPEGAVFNVRLWTADA